jgi:hypothetical protein
MNTIAADDVIGTYHRDGLDSWSDARIVGAAAGVIARPKVAPADSFVLHAPLELLARAALLRNVRPEARERARQRIVWLASTYAAAGEALEDGEVYESRSPASAARDLVAALAAGDLDDVDRIACWLGAAATPQELRTLLAEAVAASLAAAAHVSILLYLLPRVAPGTHGTGALLRGPARELARYPEWRLRWFEEPGGPPVTGSLEEALLDVPHLGVPGSTFIFPLMDQAERSGIAARLLSGFVTPDVDVALARRQLARVAAWSMLQEPPEHAPYGWSHCLTMPQAVMGLAGDGLTAQTAVAIAATHVVGFRAALAQCQLVPDRDVPRYESDDVVTELATNASLHHDAHLVKYTLACFDAAGNDPSHRRLYLAAAASLASWWAEHEPTDGLFS